MDRDHSELLWGSIVFAFFFLDRSSELWGATTDVGPMDGVYKLFHLAHLYRAITILLINLWSTAKPRQDIVAAPLQKNILSSLPAYSIKRPYRKAHRLTTVDHAREYRAKYSNLPQ
ncbi:hypothetical protein JG688_00010625 [Phytophthora aleatoria]|uniref:Uncharacterized protein n=1 Tax=Phytophthora aleatoria TaxID=2496075 RepID=A0A8J5IQ12_9STRA|nr:hypothetical protein GQ600_24844 [Phytophthora cactorum]KAG6958188.1 hypothetical protein JG688_00010625 [Phytophthora aleatoria]